VNVTNIRKQKYTNYTQFSRHNYVFLSLHVSNSKRTLRQTVRPPDSQTPQPTVAAFVWNHSCVTRPTAVRLTVTHTFAGGYALD